MHSGKKDGVLQYSAIVGAHRHIATSSKPGRSPPSSSCGGGDTAFIVKKGVADSAHDKLQLLHNALQLWHSTRPHHMMASL